MGGSRYVSRSVALFGSGRDSRVPAIVPQSHPKQLREVLFDGEAWQLTAVGFLTTQLSRAGAFCRMQNRLVLEARRHRERLLQ